MDPRGNMSYQQFKPQVSHSRAHHSVRSTPHGVRPPAHLPQQSRSNTRGSSSSRAPSHQVALSSSQSQQNIRVGSKQTSQNVRRSGGGSTSNNRPSTQGHTTSSLHGHVQRTPPAPIPQQRPPAPHGYPQTSRADLFHYHSPPSSYSLSPNLEKHPIPSRSSATLGEMPLDLSRPPPSSSSRNTSVDSPLDLSGKGSSPVNFGKKSGTSTLIHVQKCSFCNASFSTINFLKKHLTKCPRKPKNLTNNDIDRWIENNFPEASTTSASSLSSTSSRVTETRAAPPKDDIRDSLPRVNGAVALGTICIKEEPAEDVISIIDIQPMGKSIDKTVYKSSAKKTVQAPPSTLTPSKPATTAAVTQSPPAAGYIHYGCIYCDKTYDKKETLHEHIKSQHAEASNVGKSSSSTSSSSNNKNASRPVLTQAQQKQPETGKQAKKNGSVDQTSTLTHSPPSSSSKSPEPRVEPTNRSVTPTRSAEKKATKRQTGNIMSIADNLMRRMAEKTQHTDKSSPTDVSAKSVSLVEEKEPAPVEEKKSDYKISAKETSKEVERVEETAPVSKETEKEVSSPIAVVEPIVIEPEKPSKAKHTPVKASKASKSAVERSKSKGKDTTKAQKSIEKEKPQEEESIQPSTTKDEPRRTRESRREAAKASAFTEVVPEPRKSKESVKISEPIEKIASVSKALKIPVKETVSKEVEEAKAPAEKQPKSPTRKLAKGEKMTREKVADIAKLALDMGCLRRSPRAAKPGSGLPSPLPPVAEPPVTKPDPPPSKKAKVKNDEEAKEEAPLIPVKKAKKRALEEAPLDPPSKKSKQQSPSKKSKKDKSKQKLVDVKQPVEQKESKKVEEEKVETTKKEAKKVEEEKVEAIKSKSTTKGTKHVKGKKSEKKSSSKKGADGKKTSSHGIEKYFDKKEKSGKAKKEVVVAKVLDGHVAKVSKKARPAKASEKDKAKKKTSLDQQELEAVEELIKLSQSEGPKVTKSSDSQAKIDDVYNRHIAAIKGKINKKGRNKKNKHKSTAHVEEQVDGDKVPRIVGRKAYKEWLKNQSSVKDKSEEIAKKQDLSSATDLPKLTRDKRKDKKKKTYEEIEEEDDEDDDEDYLIDLNDENDMDIGSDYEKDEGNDQSWESNSKSHKYSTTEEFDLECAKCKGPVKGRKDFSKHMLCHTPEGENAMGEIKIVWCPVCAQEFRNKNRCWGHMVREHAGVKSFHECPYCFKKYSRRDAVQVHVASVHPKERRRELAEKNGWEAKEEEEEEEFKDEDVDVDLTCKRCNRPIQNKADCYTHIMLHSPRGKRKVCPLCDKTSKDSSRVWEHVMVEHAGIKPFGCDQCPFRCAHEENLKKHIQTFHGKFLDPVARVKMDFESENWDLGVNPAYVQEPQGPLPLSSGNVISLIELSLNSLIINQRTKVMNLNLLLSGQNLDLRTVINEALQNGGMASTNINCSPSKDAKLTSPLKKEENNNKENDEEEETMDDDYSNFPDDPAVIASKAMIPADCIDMELPCVLCPMGVKGADEFKLHVLKHICDSTRICPVCRRAFSRKSSCRRHLVEHTFKWRHKCNLCSQTFPKAQYLEKHYPKHVEQGFQCLNCLAKFEDEDNLWMHIHPNRPLTLKDSSLGPADNVKFWCRRVHVCEKCHQEFRSAWGLQYHRENTHSEGAIEEEKPFMCLTCGKRFKSNITLRNHQEIHVEDCSYLCRHCRLTCRTKRQLQKHIEYKHMEKIYKCSYCPKMFATRSRLKEHAIMHQNKTFICDICGKVYRHQRVFETHCRQHVKPPVKKHRLFPCPQCNHQSKSKEQLNLHLRRHTGERPYKCKECPKAFSSQTGLWRHQMSHAGRKPHECHLCKKTFVQKCSLDRHLLSHAGIKPYRCEYCGAEYSQSYPLTKHMEKKHPGMPFIIIKKDVDPVAMETRPAPTAEEPQSPSTPDKVAEAVERVAEAAAEAAKRAAVEAINSLPGVAPVGNVVQRVTDNLDNILPDGDDEAKEFISV